MPWLQMRAGEEGKPAVIDILGEIGASFWDDSATSAKEFNEQLKALGSPVEAELNINSPGGSYFDGVAIASIMRNSSTTFTTRNIGQASSAASVIFAAGTKRVAMRGSLSLVHDPANTLMGAYTAPEMVKMAEDLEKVKHAALDVYESVFNVSRDAVAEIMAESTLLTADESLAYGYATHVEDGPAVTASAEAVQADAQAAMQAVMVMAQGKEIAALTSKLGEVTTELSNLKALPVAADANAVIAACEEASMPTFFAPSMIKEKLPLRMVQERITLMGQVNDICVAANLDSAAIMQHIGNVPDMLRTAVAEAQAAADPNLNNHLNDDRQNKGSTGVVQPNRKAIYQNRNPQ